MEAEKIRVIGVILGETGLYGFKEKAVRIISNVPVLSPSPTLPTDAVFPESSTPFLRAAVHNLFGTRHWFHERQFSHSPWVRDDFGVIQKYRFSYKNLMPLLI